METVVPLTGIPGNELRITHSACKGRNYILPNILHMDSRRLSVPDRHRPVNICNCFRRLMPVALPSGKGLVESLYAIVKAKVYGL